MEDYIGTTRLRILAGDIVEQDTQAVVNAANSGLLGGGGVDGAIHRAGGPVILEECKKIRAAQGGCPAGQAVITSGGNLKARYVIHTVGPIWHGGRDNEDELLRSAYWQSLSLAAAHGIRSVSFPSISTGAYRFPVQRAARIALRAVRDFVQANNCFEEIRFILFSRQLLDEFVTAWKEMEC